LAAFTSTAKVQGIVLDIKLQSSTMPTFHPDGSNLPFRKLYLGQEDIVDLNLIDTLEDAGTVYGMKAFRYYTDPASDVFKSTLVYKFAGKWCEVPQSDFLRTVENTSRVFVLWISTTSDAMQMQQQRLISGDIVPNDDIVLHGDIIPPSDDDASDGRAATVTVTDQDVIDDSRLSDHCYIIRGGSRQQKCTLLQQILARLSNLRLP
jgi:hypothetical protein